MECLKEQNRLRFIVYYDYCHIGPVTNSCSSDLMSFHPGGFRSLENVTARKLITVQSTGHADDA